MTDAQDNARKAMLAAQEIRMHLWRGGRTAEAMGQHWSADDEGVAAVILKHFPSPPSSAGERAAFEAMYVACKALLGWSPRVKIKRGRSEFADVYMAALTAVQAADTLCKICRQPYDHWEHRNCPHCGGQARAAMGEARKGLTDIAAERQRQIDVEGWTAEHDDNHAEGAMARAAGCYAMHAGGVTAMGYDDPLKPSADTAWSKPQHFPWDAEWWKPKDRRRDLVKAGALILAEIERIDRLVAQ